MSSLSKLGFKTSFFIDFIGLGHNSSLNCIFTEINCILEKICPNILSKVNKTTIVNFDFGGKDYNVMSYFLC